MVFPEFRTELVSFNIFSHIALHFFQALNTIGEKWSEVVGGERFFEYWFPPRGYKLLRGRDFIHYSS